ncbi:MAG: hypothetical protein IT159_09065 [Bryobacterales bacterium]|nr:hypothetical protein [Bryobacterales bacterium]
MGRTARIIGVVLALLLLAAFGLPFVVSADRFRPALESKLSSALGRRVTIGRLQLSFLNGGVAAGNLAIADDESFGRAPFLQARSLKVTVELWPLIASRRLNVTGLTIERPQVVLLQAPDGRWNYSSLGGGSEPAASPPQAPSGQDSLALSARLVRIVDGRFSLGSTGGRQKPLTLESVNLEVRDFAPSAAFPFSFAAKVAGGGEIKLDGKAGPVDRENIFLTPFSVSLDIARLNLAAALAGTAPGIGGIAAVKAAANSGGGRLELKGQLRAEGLKLAKSAVPARRAVEFDFAADHDLRQHAGALKTGNLRVGAAAASLTGTYTQRGESVLLHMKFAGSKMPVPELAELLPPLGVALPNGSSLEGGTASVAFTVEGPADGPIADGSVSVDKTRLANFDLGTRMAVIERLAGIRGGPNTDIEIFGAALRYTPQGMAVENLQFVAQGIGELKGAGTISPTNTLDFKMSATIQTSRSAALSRTAVPFFVQGTAMNPVFRPDISGLAKTQAKSIVQSEVQKRLKGGAGEAVGGLLDSLLGGKKK